MKKIIVLALALSMLALVLIGCTATPAHFEGEWHFSEVTKLTLIPDTDESVIDSLKGSYGVSDEAGIEASALAELKADKVFDAFYLNFGEPHTYTYDPALDREATWKFYKTGESEGFLSFYTELDAADGNPDPVVCPAVVYDAQSDTMLVTVSYRDFMVTVKLSR